MQENRQSTLKGIYGIGGDERYDETRRRKITSNTTMEGYWWYRSRHCSMNREAEINSPG